MLQKFFFFFFFGKNWIFDSKFVFEIFPTAKLLRLLSFFFYYFELKKNKTRNYTKSHILWHESKKKMYVFMWTTKWDRKTDKFKLNPSKLIDFKNGNFFSISTVIPNAPDKFLWYFFIFKWQFFVLLWTEKLLFGDEKSSLS